MRELARAAEERQASAFRPGTVANQRSHLLLYFGFTIFFGLTALPAVPQVLLLFGEFLLRTYQAPKAVMNVLSSIRGFHLLHGLPTGGCDHYRLFLFKRSLPLTLRHTPLQAPPLPFSLLEQLCARAARRGGLGVVFRALLAMVFFSMGRLSSFVPAQRGRLDTTRMPTSADVQRTETGFRLRLKWGKAQQDAADAYWVPLEPCAGSPACPVEALKALQALGGGSGARVSLFAFPRGTAQAVRDHRHFTMGLARRWLRWLLEDLGRKGDSYTFHSLRRGACTLAADRGAGVPDIMRLGGWKSQAVQLYMSADTARARAAACLATASS